MKKKLLLFVLAGLTTCVSAQQATLDFESLPLAAADTFYNGSDNAGEFTMQAPFGTTLSFSNIFTDFGGGFYGWSGFSYSNMTDNTTAGYSNQYSSYVGSGANGSAKYGVYYPEGLLSFSQNTIVDSLKISNTTYAALSMLNGDSYAKQFGSVNNAQGNPDGTNGEDFFRVWIIGFDATMQRTDSVEFYLADYRFSDNNQDYILDAWTNVALGSLGPVRHIGFKLESSDNGQWGMNTPAYFAIDNVTISNTLSLPKTEIKSWSVYPNPTTDKLTVSNFNGKLALVNTLGEEVLQAENGALLDLSNLTSGVYFLKLNENGRQESIKIIKK